MNSHMAFAWLRPLWFTFACPQEVDLVPEQERSRAAASRDGSLPARRSFRALPVAYLNGLDYVSLNRLDR